MSKPAEIKAPGRWADEPEGDELDQHLGDVFRTLEDESALPQAALARVGRRLAHGREPVRRRPLRAAPLVLVVLTAGASAALANWALPAGWSVQRLFERAPSASPVERVSGRSASARLQSPALVSEPASEQQAAVAQVSTPDAAASGGEARVPAPRALPPAPSVNAPEQAEPSALALESEALQKALERLRRDRDPNGALKLLDDYQARYPRGVLSLEAAVARIDALLLVGRRAEALERLERLPLERVGRRSELQLVRGELYGERDCSRAIADFSAVLALDGSGPFGERALYGRAMCRLRQADPAASSDLRAYLARYPGGRFAGAVRQQLVARSE